MSDRFYRSPLSLDEKLDAHLSLRDEIFEYFGYVENWRVLPIDDARGNYWRIVEGADFVGVGKTDVVRFADTVEALLDEDSEQLYESEIYTQRHLPKWVYRGEKHTMIVVDTHTDGNQFLQIFDNDKERP
jgi:hypothetical protein